MNIRKTWNSIIELGCGLFDSDEDVKLRKIQNILIVVLFISFCWAILFEALLGLHMLFFLRSGIAGIARLFIYYVPVTIASLGVTVLCLSLQGKRKDSLCAMMAFFTGVAWNFWFCISLSFESMFFLTKLVFVPLPLIALPGRTRADRAVIAAATLFVVVALIGDFAYHRHYAPLSPLPEMYTTWLLGFVLYAVVAALITIFHYVSKITDDAEAGLALERERSEGLLLNILPASVAQELKQAGQSRPVRFDQVTIMLTDIAGFTRMADRTDPEVLVRELDNCFSSFDAVMEKYNLEKLKTIGDAYMCAGGVPVENRTNAIDTVLAALEIRRLMARAKKNAAGNEGFVWDIRIGIATGPVIAGVIGEKKFTYDVWGEAVTTAGILEIYGKVGDVNISKATHERLMGLFNCRYRGKIEVGEGRRMEMYFVKSIKKEYSVDSGGVVPNSSFMEIYESVKRGDGCPPGRVSGCAGRGN